MPNYVAMQPIDPTLPLFPGRDIDIVACERPDRSDRCIGVRWAARPEIGHPRKGFAVYRSAASAQTLLPDAVPIGVFVLPPTHDWHAFASVAEQRRPACGPYFDGIQEQDLGYLLPLIRLVDPETDAGEHTALVMNAAAFFGQPHRFNAELAFEIWQHGPVPPLQDLLVNPATRTALLRYYYLHTQSFLFVLALRFEYAVLLGLACDDRQADGDVRYWVRADLGRVGTAASDPVLTNAPCVVPAPSQLQLERVPGSVPHPAFALWPHWSMPGELAPEGPDGQPLPASALVPKVPALMTGLSWGAPPARPTTRLLHHGPVLYALARFDHGAVSAELAQTPPLPADAQFTPLEDGELVFRGEARPQHVDRPGMPWPPLEGHYRYRVRGVDLFGNHSAPTHAAIRHFDDLAPPAPAIVNRSGALIALPRPDQPQRIRLEVDLHWDAEHEFGGPDAVEFRADVSFTPRVWFAVQLREQQGETTLQATFAVADIPVPADRWAGLKLITPGRDFFIVSHGSGANATMTVRKSNGRAPEPEIAAGVEAAGPATVRRRIARLERTPVAPATVARVVSMQPLDIELTPGAGAAMPTTASARLYLALLRQSVGATRQAGQRWRLAIPAPDGPGRDAWNAWLATANPRDSLTHSPVLVFPPHKLDLEVAPPTGWQVGLMHLRVTASDARAYIDSPTIGADDPALRELKGNESAPAESVLSVRSQAPPPAVEVDAGFPIWAESAADFAEHAHVTLSWSATPGAVRYEVWRALEGALGADAPGLDHAALRTRATQRPEAFEKRSDQIFGTQYEDALPGRAPTRALYHVRAVGQNGEVGPPSLPVGPVLVPDVRRPAMPNLVRVVATRPPELDRGIAVEWTQTGPLENLRFDVFCRESSEAAVERPWVRAGELAYDAYSGPRQYRFVHAERIPGMRYHYRVVAVRVVPDPTGGGTTREIHGPFSNTQSGVAVSVSPLAAPVSLSALAPGGRQVDLQWLNRDHYRRIEVRRRGSGQLRFHTIATVDGELEQHRDTVPTPGVWQYRLVGFGFNRSAQTEIDAEIDVE